MLNKGTLVDANTNVQTDPRTSAQLLDMFNQMEATQSTAGQSVAQTVLAYDSSQTSDYQTYWSFRNQQVNSDSVGGLTQGVTYYVQVLNSTQFYLSTDAAGKDVVALAPSLANTPGVTQGFYVGNTSNYIEFDGVAGVTAPNSTTSGGVSTANEITVASTTGLTGQQVTYERLVAYNPNYVVTLSQAQIAAYTAYYTSEAQYRSVTGVSGGNLQFAGNPGFVAGDVVTFTSGGSNITGLNENQTYYVVSDQAVSVNGKPDGSYAVALSATPTGPAISLALANGATTLTGTPGLQFAANSASLTAYVNNAIATIEAQNTQEYHSLNAVWGSVGNINSSPEAGGVLTQYSADIYDPNFSYSASTSQIQQAIASLNTTPITVGATTYAAGQAVYIGTNVFASNQAVVYHADSSNPIIGLTNGSTYYITELAGNNGWIALSSTAGGPAITLSGLTAGTDNYFVSSTVNDPRLHQSATQVNGNEIFIGTNAFTNGQAVVYNADPNAGISGLVNGTTYYVIEIPVSATDNTNSGWISLSATAGGTAITIITQGALTGNNWFSDGDVFSKDASWSATQLANNLNVNILAPKDVSSTQALIQAPCITANSIAVIASGGNIGSNEGYLYFNLPLEGLTTAEEIAIAAAQRQDITFYSGPLVNGQPTGSVISLDYNSSKGQSAPSLSSAESVAINQDWNVEFKTSAMGTVYFSAPAGTVDVGSQQTINIDQVIAYGQITINGNDGITVLSNMTPAIVNTSGDLIIEAGQGGIGSASDPLLTDLPDGSMTALASDNIYITETTYNINVADIYTPDDVYLVAAQSILDAYTPPNVLASTAQIQADNLYLYADTGTSGQIGASANPVQIHTALTGDLYAVANGGIYLNATSSLNSAFGGINIASVTSKNGDVQLDAEAGSILRTSSSPTSTDVSGDSVLLTASAAIGTGTSPIIIHTDADNTIPGTFSASSGYNLYVTEESGDLLLGTIATGVGPLGGEYSAFISAPGGSILNGLASGANITSGLTYLFASGAIGTASDPITSATPTGMATAHVQGLSQTGGIYLTNTGSLTVDNTVTGSGDSMNAGGSIGVHSNCPITVTGQVVAQDNISYSNTYDANLGNDITITGSTLTATTGAITIDSVGGVSITNSTLTSNGVNLNGFGIQVLAGSSNIVGSTTISGSILEAKGYNIQMLAYGDVAIENNSTVEVANDTTGDIAVQAGGNVTVDATSTVSSPATIEIDGAYQSIPTPSAAGSTIDIYGTLSAVTTTIQGGPDNDTILLQDATLTGTGFVYGDGGNDSITVNALNSTAGNTVTIDGTGGTNKPSSTGNTAYNITYSGTGNYLINVADTGAAPTAVNLTSAGTGTQTLSPVMPALSASYVANATSTTGYGYTFDASANVANNQITIAGQQFQTGDVVRYDHGSVTDPDNIGGLNNGQLYYVVVNGNNTVSLAATLGDAMAGKIIALTAGSGTQSLDAPVAQATFNAATVVSTTTNAINIPGNGYVNGERVIYNDGGGTPIAGLTNGQSYYVIVVDANHIQLSATPLKDESSLTINGTNSAENILMRASSNPAGTAFVALLNSSTATERINYTTAVEDLILNTGSGNDTVTMDDNWTYTLVQGGGGNDTFLVGQIYQLQRDAEAGVAAGDVFATTLTSQGYLSNGVSFETTILGGSGNSTFDVYRNVGRLDLDGQTGNDTFIIRAFASNSSHTAVHAGTGTDTIEYVANANISIDGGTGDDTLEFIGTEFDDTFDVTATGIYGLGRTIEFGSITNVIIDGAEGNDLFYIDGTAAGTTLTLWGGTGSAQFIIGGVPPAVDAGQRDTNNQPILFTPPVPAAGYGNLASMQGTIVVNGGSSANLPFALDKPVMLPGESNFAASTGQIIAFNLGANGAADTITVSTADLIAAAEALNYTGATTQLLLDNLATQLNTISVTDGNDAGAIWQITSVTVSATNPSQTILTLQRPTQYNVTAPPAKGDLYGITSLSSNFFVNEAAQVNFLTIFDQNSPVADTATLTANSLVVTAGASTATIDYNNVEGLQLFLGNQGNTINITSTLGRSDFRDVTMVYAGEGNNNVTVALNQASDGMLALDLGNGNNVVDASASTVGMVIIGGNGNNTITGGQGNDMIFGGPASVDYYNASGTLVTQLGVPLDDLNLLGHSVTGASAVTPPYGQTDGSLQDSIVATSLGTGGNNTIVDGSGNDIIMGGAGVNNITVGNGNDVVFGANGSVNIAANGNFTTVATIDPSIGGTDTIIAGNGNNGIFGGFGADTITAGNGTNFVFGDNGSLTYTNGVVSLAQTVDSSIGSADTIKVGNGTNYVFGGDGSDSITAGSGTKYVFGDNGSLTFTNGVVTQAETLDPTMGAGNTITAGDGNNTIFGGFGDNTITAGNGTNFVFGNNGSITSSNGVVSQAATLDPSIASNNTIFAGTGTNYIFGGLGADQITAGYDSDHVTPGTGTNYVFGDDGSITFTNGVVTQAKTVDPLDGAANMIEVGDGTNYVFGGLGNNNISAGNGTNFVFGNNGTLTFTNGVVSLAETLDSPNGSNNTIFAGTGTNYIFGGLGADQITAGFAADHVTPGNGTNYVFGDDGSITFANGAVTEAETVDSAIGGNDTITAGNGSNYIFGGDGANSITAGTGTNYVIGHNGSVTFSGGAVTEAQTVDSAIGGNNTIKVGDGTAYIFGGFGNNTITAGDGTNYILGSNGSITLANGIVTEMTSVDPSIGGNETITAGNGANYIIGGFGSNTITAGNGGNVLIGHSGTVIFNADGSRNNIYSTSNNIGGNSTLTSGTGNDILIGGAGNNILYGGGASASGFDVLFGNGGMVTYGPGNHLTVQSLDIREGGSNQLFAGTSGNAIMIGGLGPNDFTGSFNTDLMVGQFAYLEFIGDRIVTASCWWFADDVIAKALSTLYSPQTGDNGQSLFQAREAAAVSEADLHVGVYTQASVNAIVAENRNFDAAVAVEQKHGSDETSRMQQAQSSHPGSYDARLQVPEKKAEHEEDRPVKHHEEHREERREEHRDEQPNGASAKPYGGKKNAVVAAQGKTTQIAASNGPKQNHAASAPRGPEQGAKHNDLSLALAGLVGWGALATGGSKETSGLLSKDGFKRLRNKSDNDRFLSLSAGPWNHGTSNENPADTTQQP